MSAATPDGVCIQCQSEGAESETSFCANSMCMILLQGCIPSLLPNTDFDDI